MSISSPIWDKLSQFFWLSCKPTFGLLVSWQLISFTTNHKAKQRCVLYLVGGVGFLSSLMFLLYTNHSKTWIFLHSDCSHFFSERWWSNWSYWLDFHQGTFSVRGELLRCLLFYCTEHKFSTKLFEFWRTTESPVIKSQHISLSLKKKKNWGKIHEQQSNNNVWKHSGEKHNLETLNIKNSIIK